MLMLSWVKLHGINAHSVSPLYSYIAIQYQFILLSE